MKIFKRRERFCFIDEKGQMKKFGSLEEAKKAGGVQEHVAVSGVPYKVDSSDIDLGDNDE